MYFSVETLEGDGVKRIALINDSPFQHKKWGTPPRRINNISETQIDLWLWLIKIDK